MERFCELKDGTPFSWEVAEQYDPAKERFCAREYTLDQGALKLKQPG